MSINYQSWYKGATYPSWDIPLNIGANAADVDAVPEDLTGVDITKFTLIFRNTAVSPAIDTTGTGTFSIKRNYPAEVFYKPSPADVASAFSGFIYIKAYYPPSGTNADEVVYDGISFQITDW